MNDIIDAKIFLNSPISFKGICKIYPPTIKEVIDDDTFLIFKDIITKSQEEIEDIYVEQGLTDTPLTPMEYLFNNCYNNFEIKKIVEEGFKKILREPVFFLFTKKIIIVGMLEDELSQIKDVNQLRMITENDYFEFQNYIRVAVGDKEIEPPNPNEDPRIKRIKAKARYRDKIKAKQGIGLKLSTMLYCLSVMFRQLPEDIGNKVNYASASILMEYWQAEARYNIEIDSMIFNPPMTKHKKRKTPETWIQNRKE